MNAILKKKINILVQLAAVDGSFVQKEKSLIKDICDRNGISKAELNEIMVSPEPIGSLGALSYLTIVEYMTEALLLMLVDGKVLQSEVLFCEDIGLRLGFTKASVDGLIDQIRQQVDIDEASLKKLVAALPHPLKS